MSAANHYCVFEAGGEFFAAAAAHVREVTARPSYAKAPCPSRVLAGVWHEGTEFLPVLRLPFASATAAGAERQVLVVQCPAGRWGLLADQVHNIAAIECSLGDQSNGSEWSQAVMGMSTWQGKSVRVLDLDGLYRVFEEVLKAEWSCQTDRLRETPSSFERKAIA